MPPYRVVGTVYLYPGSEPDSLLDRSTEMFVPIVDARGDARRRAHRATARRTRSSSTAHYLRGVEQVDDRTGERHEKLPGCVAGRRELDRSRPLTATVAPSRDARRSGAGGRLAVRPSRKPAFAAGAAARTPSTRSARASKSSVIFSLGNMLDDRPALVGGADEEQAAGSDQGQGRHPDRPLHVRDRHAAVGPVDDQGQPLAAAEPDGDVAQLDGGAEGRHVRRDRDEDPVGHARRSPG